jgi:hypothetical protein
MLSKCYEILITSINIIVKLIGITWAGRVERIGKKAYSVLVGKSGVKRYWKDLFVAGGIILK